MLPHRKEQVMFEYGEINWITLLFLKAVTMNFKKFIVTAWYMAVNHLPHSDINYFTYRLWMKEFV